MTTTLPPLDYTRLGTVFAVYGGVDPLICACFSGVHVGEWTLVLSVVDDLWVSRWISKKQEATFCVTRICCHVDSSHPVVACD